MDVDAEEQKTKPTDEAVEEDEDEDQAAIRKIMGFGKFKSTKNTKVPGNDKNYGVRKEKKTEYRQYMNRTGGFNRPLSPG
jgi:U4/U6.U5 tri-snRNP-associated protein 3